MHRAQKLNPKMHTLGTWAASVHVGAYEPFRSKFVKQVFAGQRDDSVGKSTCL